MRTCLPTPASSYADGGTATSIAPQLKLRQPFSAASVGLATGEATEIKREIVP